MSASAPVQLAPARPAFSTEGRVGLVIDVGAVLLALLVVDRPSTMLALLLVNAATSSAVSLGIWPRSLRRVVAPVPHSAVVLPAQIATGRLVSSTLATVATLTLVVTGVVPPAVLGAGAGAKVGSCGAPGRSPSSSGPMVAECCEPSAAGPASRRCTPSPAERPLSARAVHAQL